MAAIKLKKIIAQKDISSLLNNLITSLGGDISIQDIEVDASELGTEKNCCGQTMYGSYGGFGFYIYPTETLNLSCLNSGTTVNMTVYALDVPNRFTVYRNGSIVATSNWIGWTTSPGPWGSSLSGPSQMNLSFTYFSGSTYTLRVETVTTGKRIDEWYASVNCTCPATGCTDDCGEGFDGEYNGFGFYIYPDEAIDLGCVGIGCNISVTANALEVPNRFNIYKGGSLITSSGWIGWSNDPGPWGPALFGPSSTTLNFSYQGGNNYVLRVETVAPANRVDEWYASIGCQDNCGGD